MPIEFTTTLKQRDMIKEGKIDEVFEEIIKKSKGGKNDEVK